MIDIIKPRILPIDTVLLFLERWLQLSSCRQAEPSPPPKITNKSKLLKKIRRISIQYFQLKENGPFIVNSLD